MARFCLTDGKSVVRFLGLVNLIRGTAEAIMNALQGFLVEKGIDITMARFLAFDGCNTMSGVQKGRHRVLTVLCYLLNL